MSLRWNVSKVKDYDTNFPAIKGEDGQDHWNAITQGINMLAMFCGVSEITDKNYLDVAARFVAWQKVNGCILTDGHVIDLKDVHLHVGYTVNVSPTTKAAFLKGLAGQLWDNTLRELKTAS